VGPWAVEVAEDHEVRAVVLQRQGERPDRGGSDGLVAVGGEL